MEHTTVTLWQNKGSFPKLADNAVLLDSMGYWKHHNTVQSPPIMERVRLNVLVRAKIPWPIPKTRLGTLMGARDLGDLGSFIECRFWGLHGCRVVSHVMQALLNKQSQ